jgi:uncharacterized protein YnzC (UPF0291/DUF896 family)
MEKNMKRAIIIFVLLTSFEGYAKNAKTKFILGNDYDCAHYLRPVDKVSYEQKLEGLSKFTNKKDEECVMDLVNHLKSIHSVNTQIYLNNMLVDLQNYLPEKQLVVKAISKISTEKLVPILVETMLSIYVQKFKESKILAGDYSLYVDEIEEYFKLRKEVALTVALLAERQPELMKNYIDEIKVGLSHPVYTYLDNDGKEKVIDVATYTREIEKSLGDAMEILRK